MILKTTTWPRLIIVLLLGFSSGLPFALLGTTLQAWFADAGLSVMQVGLLTLLGLPYTYRMVFAPLLDRYSRRGWMMGTQFLLLIGFNILAWLNPNDASQSIAILACVLSLFSAMQDTAIDAQRIEYLNETDYGLGASLAVLGYRVAILMGAGVALIMAGKYGWAWTYRLMGGLMSVGLLAAWCSEEPVRPSIPGQGWKGWVEPFLDLVQREHALWLFLFILCFKLGEAFTTTTSGVIMPFLRQELDFSLETIGYVNKIMGVFALLTGGIMAGLILRKGSLYCALIWFGLIQAVSNLLFLALAINGKQLWLFMTAVVVDNWAAGMGTTALVALLMQVVNKRYTATQFSILVAISALPRIVGGPLGAWIQAQVGWVGLFEWAFGLSFLFLPIIFKLKGYCSTSLVSN